jgi:hypothetical protein
MLRGLNIALVIRPLPTLNPFCVVNVGKGRHSPVSDSTSEPDKEAIPHPSGRLRAKEQ